MIRSTIKRLWNSPTFTTWGNQLTQSLRLFLVTPLILTRFDQTEIAAWYLFASLNFFGATVSQRLSMTFSRMFAFAMGGAENLAPIRGVQSKKTDAPPNWPAFERAYGTLGSVQTWMGWINVLVALSMGAFGLNNLLKGYTSPGLVWTAFAVMLATSLITFTFQRYAVALVGMNYVALNARWGTIFSVFSVAAGATTLMLGGGIVALTMVMQVVAILGLLRVRLILGYVEEGRVLRFKSRLFDKEVFHWAWEPTWKGFIGQLGTLGAVQFTSVLYTAYGTKAEIASFLFASRMMQVIIEVGNAPFGSVAPKMSRMLASGDLAGLKGLFYKRSISSLVLTAIGIIAAAVFLPMLPHLIGANIKFLPVNAWLFFGAFTLIIRFNVINASTVTFGNQIIYYWETASAACLSLLALAYFKNSWGVYTPIVCMSVPLVLMLNVGPLRKASELFQESLLSPLAVFFLKLLLCFAVAWVAIAWLKPENISNQTGSPALFNLRLH